MGKGCVVAKGSQKELTFHGPSDGSFEESICFLGWSREGRGFRVQAFLWLGGPQVLQKGLPWLRLIQEAAYCAERPYHTGARMQPVWQKGHT